MTSLPQILHRTVDSEEARRNHLLGTLWFRSLKRFRMQEGAGRDVLDRTRSVGSSMGILQMTNRYFLLSFSVLANSPCLSMAISD
jgi:hypothetical protein